jgi:hypothetical protein
MQDFGLISFLHRHVALHATGAKSFKDNHFSHLNLLQFCESEHRFLTIERDSLSLGTPISVKE